MVIRNDDDMKDTNTVAHTPDKTSEPNVAIKNTVVNLEIQLLKIQS